MKLTTKLFIIVFIIIFAGCSKEYTKEDCEKLSQGSYRGIPNDAHKFKKYCTNMKIKYTHEVCQRALGELISSGNLKNVKNKYGDNVAGCFTKNDLQKFVLPVPVNSTD